MNPSYGYGLNSSLGSLEGGGGWELLGTMLAYFDSPLPILLLSKVYIWGRADVGCVAMHTQITHGSASPLPQICTSSFWHGLRHSHTCPWGIWFGLQFLRNRSWFSLRPWLSSTSYEECGLCNLRCFQSNFRCTSHSVSYTKFSLIFFISGCWAPLTMSNRISGNLSFTDMYLDYHSQNRGGRGGSVPHSASTLGKS